MKNKRIIIAGGTGFIGQELIKYFGRENEIIILTRQLKHSKTNRNDHTSLSDDDLLHTRFVKWDGTTPGEWVNEMNGAALVINLAGKSVNCRYTKKNKKEILESRVNATRVIGEAINKASDPPELWINASSATIYKHAVDKPGDEYTGDNRINRKAPICVSGKA